FPLIWQSSKGLFGAEYLSRMVRTTLGFPGRFERNRVPDWSGEQDMRWEALEEEPCSMARTIGVIGDRWTLLILRECFLRTRRFEGFQSALGITRHLLAER